MALESHTRGSSWYNCEESHLMTGTSIGLPAEFFATAVRISAARKKAYNMSPYEIHIHIMNIPGDSISEARNRSEGST